MPEFSKYTPTILALTAANLVLLFGVLFLGWDAFAIVVIYWAENVILGAINVLKMIACHPDPNEIKQSLLNPASGTDAEWQQAIGELNKFAGQSTAMHTVSKLFIVPFFVFHYGMFCLVHGAFVFVLFGRDQFFGPIEMPRQILRVAVDEYLVWALAALAGSHLFSFFVNYLGRGEYRRTLVPSLMMQPYGRIVVLHIAILFGGFFVMAFGSPVFLLVLLVVGKTVLDLKFHLREHQRLEKDEETDLPDSILTKSADEALR